MHAAVPPMTRVILLAPRLGLDAAVPLAAQIKAERKHDLDLDASQVAHLGALCLQVIMAAALDWAAVGRQFRLVGATDACIMQLSLFGLSPETLAAPEPIPEGAA